MSATEIEYPYTITHEEYSDSDGEFQGPKMDETEDDISVEILEGILPCPKRREKSPLPCPQPHKLMRTNSTNKTERASKLQTFVSTHSRGEELEDFKGNTDSQCSTQELGGNLKQLIHEESAGRQCTQRTSCLRVPGALEAARKFISKYPSFKVELQQAHLEYHNLHVPIKFMEKLIKQIDELSLNATLQVGDRLWPVKLNSYPHNSYAKLSCGWPAFALGNSLRVGDICVFELIRRDDAVLKVSIFRCAG